MSFEFTWLNVFFGVLIGIAIIIFYALLAALGFWLSYFITIKLGRKS